MPLPVSLEDMVACVDRELAMRAKTYPRYVKMKPPKLTQRAADQEMERLRAVRAALLQVEAQALLVSEFVEANLITRNAAQISLDRLMATVRTRFPEPA